MYKKEIVGLFIMLLVITASYFFYKKETTPDPSSMLPSIQDATKNVGETSEKENLWGLFAGAGGPSQLCTFENDTTSGSVSGTLYTSEDRMRGDFSVESEGVVTDSHMIVLDETSYIWQDGQTEGTKSVFGEEPLSILGESGVSTESTDENTEGKYECQEWGVDESFFELPTDVEFVSP